MRSALLMIHMSWCFMTNITRPSTAIASTSNWTDGNAYCSSMCGALFKTILLALCSICMPSPGLSAATNLCVDPNIIDGWYDGDSIDIANNVWTDKSVNNNDGSISVSTGIGVSDGTTETHELFTHFNRIAVYGATTTQIEFNVDLHPTNHTVIHYCKYRDSGTKQRILQATMEDSVFGFWGGLSGQAYEYSAFITDGVTDHFGSEWVLSAQQRDLYRGNGIDLTVNPTGTFQVTQTLDINKGFKPEKSSDWACTEIIIINQKIPLDDIICIENYLLEKYSTNAPTTAPTSAPSNAPSFPTTNPTNAPSNAPTVPSIPPTMAPTAKLQWCVDTDTIGAWYDGDSIDIANDIWTDK
eukprot:1035835_1